MSEESPNFPPLPLAPRETAPYFVRIDPWRPPDFGVKSWRENPFRESPATVQVKEGDFFRNQNGLTQDWGKNWVGIEAVSLDDARLKAHASVGSTCPSWHLSGGDHYS